MTQFDVLADKLRTLEELARSTVIDHDDPLALVQLLRMIGQTAESAQRQAVPLALNAGATWSEIGKALGTTRQSAHEKYAA